jgi:hypothetical protein
LELAGWYQTVPYLRLRSQMGWHIAIESYLPMNYNHSGTRKGEKVILPNGWRKHDSDRSLLNKDAHARGHDRSPWRLALNKWIK